MVTAPSLLFVAIYSVMIWADSSASKESAHHVSPRGSDRRIDEAATDATLRTLLGPGSSGDLELGADRSIAPVSTTTATKPPTKQASETKEKEEKGGSDEDEETTQPAWKGFLWGTPSGDDFEDATDKSKSDQTEETPVDRPGLFGWRKAEPEDKQETSKESTENSSWLGRLLPSKEDDSDSEEADESSRPWFLGRFTGNRTESEEKDNEEPKSSSFWPPKATEPTEEEDNPSAGGSDQAKTGNAAETETSEQTGQPSLLQRLNIIQSTDEDDTDEDDTEESDTAQSSTSFLQLFRPSNQADDTEDQNDKDGPIVSQDDGSHEEEEDDVEELDSAMGAAGGQETAPEPLVRQPARSLFQRFSSKPSEEHKDSATDRGVVILKLEDNDSSQISVSEGKKEETIDAETKPSTEQAEIVEEEEEQIDEKDLPAKELADESQSPEGEGVVKPSDKVANDESSDSDEKAKAKEIMSTEANDEDATSKSENKTSASTSNYDSKKDKSKTQKPDEPKRSFWKPVPQAQPMHPGAMQPRPYGGSPYLQGTPVFLGSGPPQETPAHNKQIVMELTASLVATGLRLWYLTYLTRKLASQDERIRPVQHFVWERLNDRYSRDNGVLQRSVAEPPRGIRESRWRRKHVRRQGRFIREREDLAKKFSTTVVVWDISVGPQNPLDVDHLAEVVTFLIDRHTNHAFGTDKETGEARQLEVILNIESPGGSVALYGLASAQIQRLSSVPGIETTACVDQCAASGGYMIASQAHRIVAAPFATIGSIGVIMETLNFNQVLRKYGIRPTILKSGASKNPVSAFGENSPNDLYREKKVLSRIHKAFRNLVVAARPNLAANLEKTMDGSIFLGMEAAENNLVDAVMTSSEYIALNIAAGNRVLKLHKAQHSHFSHRFRISPLDILPHMKSWFQQNVLGVTREKRIVNGLQLATIAGLAKQLADQLRRPRY